jgi:hypothetical protein
MSIRTRLAARHTSRALFAAVLVGGLAATAGAMNDYVLAGAVPGGGVRTHALAVGYSDNGIIVRGTRGLDIDCWVYDSDGELVDSDTDTTPICLLETPGLGTHRVVIRNLSSRRSEYSLRQTQ